MKNKSAIIINSIFWSGIIGLTVLGLYGNRDKLTLHEFLVNHLAFLIINISLYFINYLILIPSFTKRKQRAWLYVFAVLGLLLVTVAIKFGLAVMYREEVLRFAERGAKEMEYQSYDHFIVQALFTSGFYLVMSSLLKFAADWFSSQRIQSNLESEKKNMELQFLKSQLNPHFLFNSLNNIYSLAYQKSDKTADAILKLSEIMRYMIYESNDSWVSLNKEVEYVQSFVELQKLRFKDGAAVEISINGEIDGQKIVPLILISFVENAFKHGVANDPEDPIKINIIANQKILHFSVTNKKSKTNKDAMGGVGLNNVERRLQLLYPERYKLNIVNSATHYTTELMLDL
ncbi:sensor histidine kinase [Pedobacter sp. ASV12]|uniref:sensor histidine kinase n=1 Tax=Pedobacter sp. ASV12 TaxID=2795120 RepID=UPI0018EA4CC8|nr:sensor histidine kinase [Pedobacter sp. ASV12]